MKLQLNTIARVAAAGLIGVGIALGAHAQTTPAAKADTAAPASVNANANAKVASGDRSFAEKAALGGMMEVELGNLAKQKARSAEVKQFGEKLVSDHSKANEELKQIAGNKGITLPTTLDKKHQQDVDKLGKLSGDEFDKAFMKHMVSDHKKDISAFKKQAKSGQDAELKAFASKTLPTLEEHLKLAQATHTALAKPGKSGSRGAP